MPVTALKITKEDGDIIRIKIMTVYNPPFTDVDIFQCDEDFFPIGNPKMTTSEMDEETYHKKLRIDASEKNQFIPEESTDRHWNPGYVEPPDEIEDGS